MINYDFNYSKEVGINESNNPVYQNHEVSFSPEKGLIITDECLLTTEDLKKIRDKANNFSDYEMWNIDGACDRTPAWAQKVFNWRYMAELLNVKVNRQENPDNYKAIPQENDFEEALQNISDDAMFGAIISMAGLVRTIQYGKIDSAREVALEDSGNVVCDSECYEMYSNL